MAVKVWLDDQRGRLLYFSDIFPASLFASIDQGVEWQQDAIKIFGRSVDLPRLTAWYGDPGASYQYSGILNIPKPWIECLMPIKAKVEQLSGQRFNSVLLNRYAHGEHYQGYHADDEPELGPEPCIASVSLGAARIFRFKERVGSTRFGILLEPGSVLIMAGHLQQHFVHALPKTKKVSEPRINLTYRWVEPRKL